MKTKESVVVAIVNRLSLTIVTLGAMLAVVLLAYTGKIADGETVTTLSAVMLAYVGGHAVQKLPPNTTNTRDEGNEGNVS